MGHLVNSHNTNVLFLNSTHWETILSRFPQQHMNSVCCRWVYIMCFWNESVDVSCCLLRVRFSFCSNTSLRALDVLNSCCPRRWELDNQLVDKNTEKKQRPLSCSSRSTTDQCLSTTANRNHVFRSTFYTTTPARGNLVSLSLSLSLSLSFFFPQSKNCCQGNMFVLCNQRAPSDVRPKQGIIKCIYTHIQFRD